MSMFGKTLGHYSVSALLGKGGMGEVYQAKDQKLGRDVAIKVLPEEFAKDADRVARFQREAKLLASLNHNNIASIYGLEESEGTHFLVLELIEGDTLADRLKRGAIPVEESLKLALQIAEALEAAHEKGVIHRDLKPANIKVTSDGKVKVLDFGLAKAFAGDPEGMNLSNSPTLSAAATQQGIILGTAAYMSPEQASGEVVDKRTDIWAFGVVLFEMLTGRSLFEGNNVSQTLASVIKSEPEWKSLPTNLHPRIRLLLERCLEKDAKDRYHDISDARVDIQKVLADPSGVFAQASAVVERRTGMRTILPWIAAIMLVGIIVGLAVWQLRAPEPRQVLRFDYDLPPEIGRFSSTNFRSVDASPDGTKIVYVADNQLYLKNANEFAAKPIRGTDEDPLCPFFSPDGQWIGYFCRADYQLKKIAVMGGAPVTLCEATPGTGATWGTDDMIVFGEQGAIMRVSASGGTPEEIVKGENETFVFPQILPTGDCVLFTVVEEGRLQVAVQSLESGERNVLFRGGPAQYLPTGHIVYGLENNLVAIPFDLETLESIGGPVPLIEGVFRRGPTRPTHAAVSDSGTLVYIPGRMWPAILKTLVWVDREGNEESLAAEPYDYETLRISPDGTHVALSVTVNRNEDIYNYDLIRGTMTRLTFDEANDLYPMWNPDGQRIIFGSEREGRQSIYWKAADGTGKVEQIAAMPDEDILPMTISNDGKSLVFEQMQADKGGDNIGMLSLEGDRTPKLLLQEEYDEETSQISPDDRWIAYRSAESGQREIYIRPFPDVDSGGRWQVSTDGGSSPLWSPDGRELFYRSPDGIMAVSVETDPIFKLGTPQNLFAGPYGDWDIHPDGKRFLMIKESTTTDDESKSLFPRKINVIVNWFEELKERVPTD